MKKIKNEIIKIYNKINKENIELKKYINKINGKIEHIKYYYDNNENTIIINIKEIEEIKEIVNKYKKN